jgi:hypothetical protein
MTSHFSHTVSANQYAILHIPPVTILEESMLALAADYLAMII